MKKIELLTVADVAEVLGVSKGWVYNRIYDHIKGFFQIGERRWVIRAEDLEKYLEEQRKKYNDYE